MHTFIFVILLNVTTQEVNAIYEIFRGEVARQKKIRKLNDKDLSEMTGYTVSTIRAFSCGVRSSELVAKALARALDIEL